MPIFWILAFILALVMLGVWWLIKSALWWVFLTAFVIYVILRAYYAYRSRP